MLCICVFVFKNFSLNSFKENFNRNYTSSPPQANLCPISWCYYFVWGDDKFRVEFWFIQLSWFKLYLERAWNNLKHLEQLNVIPFASRKIHPYSTKKVCFCFVVVGYLRYFIACSISDSLLWEINLAFALVKARKRNKRWLFQPLI